MEDKILRIVRNDMVTNDGTYGRMETPQMEPQSEKERIMSVKQTEVKLPLSTSGCPATMTMPGIVTPS